VRTLLDLTALATWLCVLSSCGGGGGGGDPKNDPPPIVDPDNEPPVAVAAASAATGEAPLAVDFTAAGSADPDGEITSFIWDFGDGSTPGSGAATSHVYTAAGDFECILTVTDDQDATSTASVAISVLPESCPEFKAGVALGNVESSSVVEASGIAASRRNPGVLWVNNDSGDTERIFAMDFTGKHLGIYRVSTGPCNDWEDVAVGPGPVAGESYIYIASIGDNAKARSYVSVFRVSEPEVDLDAAPATYDLTGVVRLDMTYPEGASDAETLMVDPLTADIVIVTKRSDGQSRVYRYAYPQDPSQRPVMTHVATLSIGSTATAGDISPLGNWIVVKTYSSAFLWLRSGKEDLGESFKRPACTVPLRSEPAGEAIGFAADGSGYFTVSEGNYPPIYYFERLAGG
jgi:PKD repeat protein